MRTSQNKTTASTIFAVLWGLCTTKAPVRLFPVGYSVHTAEGVTEGRGPLRLVLGRVRRRPKPEPAIQPPDA